jgi:hypothetical protein
MTRSTSPCSMVVKTGLSTDSLTSPGATGSGLQFKVPSRNAHNAHNAQRGQRATGSGLHFEDQWGFGSFWHMVFLGRSSEQSGGRGSPGCIVQLKPSGRLCGVATLASH